MKPLNEIGAGLLLVTASVTLVCILIPAPMSNAARTVLAISMIAIYSTVRLLIQWRTGKKRSKEEG